MSPTVDDLYDIAAAFLAASEDALQQVPLGPPVRSYVSPGQPAIDCEQLVAWVETLAEAPLRTGEGALARGQAINRGGKALATVFVQVVRCVPVPQERNGKLTWPDPIDLDAAARTIDEDGWALWLGLNEALKHGSLKAECEGAERLGGTKLTPSGGFGGWTFSWRVPLAGGLLGS